MNGIKKCIICLFFVIAVWCFPIMTHAETKEAVLDTLSKTEDLLVMFTFDKEVVNITFISPSGQEYGVGSDRVESSSGKSWSTYRVKDAEAGEWKIRYDLGKNSQIEYSMIDENAGIWIQYFTMSNISGTTLNVAFEADHESENINYSYSVYVVSEKEEESEKEVASGNALSGEKTECSIDLNQISTGTYKLRLEVTYSEGEGEYFDAASTDVFEYTNPNTPERIKDYAVYVNQDDAGCRICWGDYIDGNYEKYRVQVYTDASGKEAVYDGELEGKYGETKISFPKDAKSIQMNVSYMENGVWSDAYQKEIDLVKGEYLKTDGKEITNSGQLQILYNVTEKRKLKIRLNEEKESVFQLKDEGYMGIELQQGLNNVYAEFKSSNQIYYVIDREIYCDIYPPEILLYDKLDGKTIAGKNIEILGKVTNGSKLMINKKEVELKEDGSFYYDYHMKNGENVITLTASDVNGNSTAQVLTLYKKSGILSKKFNWKDYWGLFSALAFSLLITIFSLIFLRKKKEEKDKNTEKKKSLAGLWISLLLLAGFEVGSVMEFIRRYQLSKSEEFLNIAEESVAKAAEYIRIRNILGITSFTGAVLLIVLIFVLIRLKKRRRKSSAQGEECP